MSTPPDWGPPPGSTQLPSGWNPPPPSGWTTPQPSGFGPGPGGWQQPPAKRESRLPIVIIGLLVAGLVVGVIVAAMLLMSSLGALGGGSNVSTVAVGQCFNGGRALDSSSTTILRNVEVVDCATPHESEMAASFEYPGASAAAEYPGEERMASEAQSECTGRFASYVGLSFSESIYGLTYAYPLEMNWLLGDRSIQCIAHPPDGQQTMTGSVRNSAR